MKIKDELVLHGMPLAAADNIEYNTIGEFQTIDSNTHGYYIVKWAGNAYTLQKKYKCHAFDPPVIIPEGELVCPAKFMNPMRKTPNWYNDPDESIYIMVKLKQFVKPFIKLIQDNNTRNKLPSCFKGFTFINPNLLSENDHQTILDKI